MDTTTPLRPGEVRYLDGREVQEGRIMKFKVLDGFCLGISGYGDV